MASGSGSAPQQVGRCFAAGPLGPCELQGRLARSAPVPGPTDLAYLLGRSSLRPTSFCCCKLPTCIRLCHIATHLERTVLNLRRIVSELMYKALTAPQ